MEIMLGKDVHKDDQTEIVLHSALEIKSSGKGHHAYKDIWIPVMNEKLAVFMETDNKVDKYTVYLKKNNVAVLHLPLGKT